jgi:hypothetical protein
MIRSRRFILLLILLLTACSPLEQAAPTATPSAAATAPAPALDLSFPIRAAFFYPWFPEAWEQQGVQPFTNYNPTQGFYDSSSEQIIQDQIRAMTYGRIQAGILSWWGQASPTDLRIPAILAATPGSSNPAFGWTLYYENEGYNDPTVSQIQSDLAYIQARYASQPSFLRVQGKFVVFVYGGDNDGCSMADRWVQANQALGSPAYLSLKIFTGYRKCASQPDSWHQYSPAYPAKDQKGYSFSISPGFWLKGDQARMPRDAAAWAASVRAMVASGEPWQLITTFNEWGEGTAVESAVEWTSASGYGVYLDALHDDGSLPGS